MRTRVGYAGGTRSSPTYHDMGDHTESFQVEYDPARISFEGLLDVFWDSHEPTAAPWSRQYQAILFFHDEEQRRAALASRDRLAARIGAEVRTEIRAYSGFTAAEAYHQKYRLRSSPRLMAAFRKISRTDDEFVASPAAAKVNAYLDGWLTREALEKELDAAGLAPVVAEAVAAGGSRGPACR